MIKVKNLTRNFSRNHQNFNAVNNISLQVRKGELAAVIGHSGSGKTTLFNMLAGLIRPTSGEIFIDGVDFTAMSGEKQSAFRNKNIGYVVQSQSLLNNFTILDNICMPAYLSRDITKFKDRAMHLLKEIGLEDLAQEYPRNLSGGEIRRVSIARAMLNHPKILLADEPTSNLDSENAHKVMSMIQNISNSGTTVLLSTHEMEYLDYADTVLRMENGEIK